MNKEKFILIFFFKSVNYSNNRFRNRGSVTYILLYSSMSLDQILRRDSQSIKITWAFPKTQLQGVR